MENILEVKDLHVSFYTYAGEVKAVRGVDFVVKEGETVAIVGESGCGKSVTAKSIMKLLPSPPVKYKQGSSILMGRICLLRAKKRCKKSVESKLV